MPSGAWRQHHPSAHPRDFPFCPFQPAQTFTEAGVQGLGGSHSPRASAASPRWPSAGRTTRASATSPCSLALDPSCSKGLVFQAAPAHAARSGVTRGLALGLAPGHTSLSDVRVCQLPSGMVGRDHIFPGPITAWKPGRMCWGYESVGDSEGAGAVGPGQASGGGSMCCLVPTVAPGAGLSQVCLKALSSLQCWAGPRTVGSCVGGRAAWRESAGTGPGPCIRTSQQGYWVM